MATRAVVRIFEGRVRIFRAFVFLGFVVWRCSGFRPDLSGCQDLRTLPAFERLSYGV